MKITSPEPLVILVECNTQHELCEAFVRLQEFYESPFDDIRGHYFTLDTFKDRYRDGGPYTYNKDWHGFNVPGEVVLKFAEVFAHDFTKQEAEIIAAADGLPKFYIIGVHTGEDCLDHELTHASYYLSPKYRERADALVADFRAAEPVLAGILSHLLLSWGYSEGVLTDETNAYLSTTDEQWWTDKPHELDAALAATLYAAGAPFRQLFKERRSYGS